MKNVTINSSITRAYAPDTFVFDVHITKVADTSRELTAYNKSIVDSVLAGIAELGIAEDNFREEYFRIGANREYIDNKYVDKGYRLDSKYSITSYIDYELMDQVREFLASHDIEFNIEYKIEDETEIRDEMLGEVIAESLRKAKIIAHAAGMQIGSVESVRYNARRENIALMRASVQQDAVPQDIDITESAEVVWELV